MKANLKQCKRPLAFLAILLLICVAAFGVAGQSGDSEPTGHIYAFAEEATNPPEDETPEESETPQAPPPPIELAIKDAPASLNVGDTVTLSYTLNNADVDTTVVWQSGNVEVAVVDSSGKVLAVSPGNVEIIASVGDVKSSVLISVSEIAAESIKIVVQE
ncbi:MAG: Ig-like domain-containing protein, partial [Clostridiales Family XIII bacterium]|nr:Ig-like domain-containing protein [Clostridiales Family XIII bacterium]